MALCPSENNGFAPRQNNGFIPQQKQRPCMRLIENDGFAQDLLVLWGLDFLGDRLDQITSD